MRGSPCGRCIYFSVQGLLMLITILTIVIHTFAWHDEDLEGIDWFGKANLGRIWEKTPCLMEVHWLFWIWLIVLLGQLLWMFYGMTLTWRKAQDIYLYEESTTMPITIYLLFLLGVGGNIAWYFVWGHLGYVQWAAITISISALALHLTLAASVSALMGGEANLRECDCAADVVWTQLFIHNGIAGYATWLSVATMYNIAVLLKVQALVSVDYSCSVAFGLIMLYMLVWFVVDIGTSGRRLYPIFTPYVLVILTFISALVRNVRVYRVGTDITDSLSLILSGAFLSLTALFTVIKIITVVAIGRRDKDMEEHTLMDDNVYVMQDE